MNTAYDKAIVSGVERVFAWVNLLDQINVFPIADGDTGRNLKISLSPLRQLSKGRGKTIQSLMLSARGNSGNIAARFFSGFLEADSVASLPNAVKSGRDNAREAVNEPIEGTMLTVFDALVDILKNDEIDSYNEFVPEVLTHLEKAVHSTVDLLPKLKEANVVDSGALGMYIYLDGFFNTLIGNANGFRPIMDIFKGKLTVSSDFKEEYDSGYCIDMVLRAEDSSMEAIHELTKTNESAVITRDKDYIKVHLHADDKVVARNQIESYGKVARWEDDDLGDQIQNFKNTDVQHVIQIMTDGAGSITQKDARNLGLTLLDSYIISGDRCVPETHLRPRELYESMEKGVKASTSRASDFERHQHYHSELIRHRKVLYLCVGSVYTENYNVAMEWKKNNDADDRFIIIDTGTASGCLGAIVIATARYSRKTSSAERVVKFARQAISQSIEYIFLEKLQYLAAGGRMSKTGAFFGDMFNVKPIVSPSVQGASKAGIARDRNDQIKFLHEKLSKDLTPESRAFIMLEFTNNYFWVNNSVKKEIEEKYPNAEIILQPLSLTTGVHTGPGTWGIAYLDKIDLD